nr:oxidoreductase [Zea mays]
MPLALNINPKKYLQALFSACQNLADEASSLPSEQKEIKLYKQHVDNLHLLAGNYDSVIICLGAKACSLPELANKLPLRTCRGVIAEFQLPSTTVEEYDSQSASILSDAWLAFQGPRTVSIGSTWQWISENDSSTVSDEESLTAIEELLPKASGVYPRISKWDFVRARAGIRAMPPLTTNGSLPLLGCLDDLLGNKSNCTFWLVGGLGARGLLYHGLVGKLTAKAAISCNENIIPSEFTCWNIVKP